MTTFEVASDDTLDDVLRIAADVIGENAPDPQGTRIERLAAWIVANVGGPPDTHLPMNSKPGWVTVMPYSLNTMTPARAREVAVALLRAAERAER